MTNWQRGFFWEKIVSYHEAHDLFDMYHELYDFSLKDGARDDRAQNALGTTTTVDYEIHDEMSIKKTSLNELFSSTPTKRRLTEYLALGVLDMYKNDPRHVVIVSYGPTIAINNPMSFLIHSLVTVMRKLTRSFPYIFSSVLSTMPSATYTLMPIHLTQIICASCLT